MQFESFPSISRYSRDVVITEKIDGTNAQIYITEDNEKIDPNICIRVDGLALIAGSRKRWIVPENDNFGFAKWVWQNAEELVKLGPGRHFGEWWGQGIQRGYGLKEKRFSLFNVSRWNEHNIPKCCHVVPILYKGPWDGLSGTQFSVIEAAMVKLASCGSVAAPGFMNPEGIVIFHTGKVPVLFKKTFENDAKGKGE